jgi:DNA-binding CsgD family transcriptional regulator
MNWLEEDDRKLVERTALAIQDLLTAEALEDFVIHRMPALLGADFASWNDHDAGMRLIRVSTSESHREKVAPLVGALNASLPTHPLFRKYLDFDTGAVRYVDTVDRTRAEIGEERFRALDFYRNVARPLGIEDQLVMHLYVKEGRGVIVTFHGHRLFTEREVAVAALLRGHLLARLYAIERREEKRAGLRQEALAFLLQKISSRELEVLAILCEGSSNDEISQCLGISRRTVENHVSSLLRKLRSDSRFQLIARYGNCL